MILNLIFPTVMTRVCLITVAQKGDPVQRGHNFYSSPSKTADKISANRLIILCSIGA